MTTGPAPKNQRYYRPLESPTRYPLELEDRLHIALWSPCGEYKWSIAIFDESREGYDLRFLSDRPLDPRVNWEHFRELIEQGQRIANARFNEQQESV